MLTVRRRLLLALAAALFIGYAWVTWSVQLGINLVRVARGSNYPQCSAVAWEHLGTQCSQPFSSTRGWLTLVGVALVLAGGGLVIGRWTVRPARALATTVARLGAQNLGERVPDAGGDEVGSLARETNAMLDRIVETYESQRRFAANASHELRTPLAVQRALIEVGMSGSPTSEQTALLARQLLDANRRNEELVEGLLVLAEADRGLVSRTPQRLDEITAAVTGRYAGAAADAGLALACGNEPATTTGEAVLLERLVTNLVENAIKYNVAGGWIDVRVTAEPTPRIVVTNSGPHVPAALVPSLFEPFRRAHGERLDTQGGSGLGLTIVRSIAIAHTGTVVAHPRTDGGLEIVVEFPPPTIT